MKQVDYIVVGFGIAGVCLAERLLQQGKSLMVYDDVKDGASVASGGVLNPIVLKRFTAAWNAADFFTEAIPFYKKIEVRLGKPIISSTNIQRIFNGVEEQNNWMVASDKTTLSPFLSAEIVQRTRSGAPCTPGGLLARLSGEIDFNQRGPA